MKKSRPREKASWHAMINRCENPRFPNYSFYGGRGIRVCERWLKFENFFVDMGPRPMGMSLDRIDTNGNYQAENCRWSSHLVQSNNTRASIKEVSDFMSHESFELASFLKEARLAGGLTQKQAAAACDRKPSFICSIERGNRPLGPRETYIFSKIYRVDEEILIEKQLSAIVADRVNQLTKEWLETA